MTRAKRKQRRKRIQRWKGAKPLLERWRKSLTNVAVKLKQPRIIDVESFDFVGGEPVGRKGQPTQIFRGQLIYFTNDDVTIRRPSGAVLVVDNYEIVAVSDGKTRLAPR
jgi:hypothetical protein